MADITKELFHALGDPSHKVTRWMQGAEPFCYWSREEISRAANEVSSNAKSNAEKVISEFEDVFGKLTATERRWLVRRLSGQEV